MNEILEAIGVIVAIIIGVFFWIAIPVGLISLIYWIFALFFGWVFWFPLVLAIYGICLVVKWVFSREN